MKKLFILINFLLIYSAASAQITVKLPNFTVPSNGAQISIPMDVTNFNGIGAISLKIKYDPAVLTFLTIPDPISGNFISNASNGVISIGWFGLTPLNAGNSTLLHLNFQHIQGNSDLIFVSGVCSIADTAANTLSISYVNGLVNAAVPPVPASLGDFVWRDSNLNGLQDAGEPGIAYVTVKLFKASDSSGVAWVLTDTSGHYSFTNITPGNYFLRFYLVDGNSIYKFTTSLIGSTTLNSKVVNDSGYTQVFTLAPGDNQTFWDAGVVPKILNNAKVGDFVWNDLNHNGIQELGEPGIAGVTVKLFTPANVLAGTTVTNNTGNYLFENLAPGSYYVQFTAPQGYYFSPKDQGTNVDINSKADTATGKTITFTLTDGDISTRWDAGMYTIIPVTYPVLYVNKDDNSIFMKPVGQDVTYSIAFKNTGTGNLLTPTVTDSLPTGLTYKSSTGGISSSETVKGNNIVVWHLSTVAPGDSGIVIITATVASNPPNFLNSAYFAGVDQNNNVYSTFSSDLDLADTCSGGQTGGLESKGDLAELIFNRRLDIMFGRTTPILSKTGPKSNGITALHSLQDVIPLSGPFSSAGVESTPYDILGISNALSDYVVDYQVSYQNSLRRVASVFSTITAAPYIYDHTKAVCDRLAGSDIDEIQNLNVNGHLFYAARMHNPVTNNYDYAISFCVYETPNGNFVDNKWTYAEYSAPQNSTFIYNFEVWSAAYSSTQELCQDILNKFATYGTLIYLNNNQMNPDLYFKNFKYTHDGKIALTTENKGVSKSVSLNINYRTTQDADQLTTVKNITVDPGESIINLPIGIISDANIVMTQPSGFKDEVFASGGTYSYVVGPTSSVSKFVTNTYPQQTISNYPDGSLILAGGANITGQLNDWSSVMRSLTADGSAYNLSGFNSIRFEASGTGVLTVLFNLTNTQNYNYYAYNITLTPGNNVYGINFSDLREILGGTHVAIDPTKINMIGFQLSKSNNTGISAFNFEVKNIAFLLGTTSVNSNQLLPTVFSLSQNYPNPFNPSTVIEFSVPQKDNLNLTIFNMLGQKVVTLVEGTMEPGVHKVIFDASHFASGVYIYRLTGSSVNLTKKMMLLK
jgi:uncharacterized repeat protein (TIGR01451 family)